LGKVLVVQFLNLPQVNNRSIQFNQRLIKVPGAFGIPGYAFKGIYEEVQKTRALEGEKDLIEVQMIQGFEEWEAASQEQRDLVFLWIRVAQCGWFGDGV